MAERDKNEDIRDVLGKNAVEGDAPSIRRRNTRNRS